MGILLITGCASVPKKSAVMQTFESDVVVSASELRIRTRELADIFSGVIEEAADQIYESSDQSTIRRNAIVWKINSIPVFQAATMLPDPGGAFAETWILSIQMRNFLEKGEGMDLFGEHQMIAVEAASRIEKQMDDLVKEMLPEMNFPRARAKVNEWCAENRIETLTFRRTSIYPLLKSEAIREGFEELGTLETITTMSQQIADIEYHLNMFNKYLPNRILWEVDLLTEEFFGELDTENLGQSARNISDSISELTPLLVKTPELVEKERTAVFQSISEERKAAIKDLDSFIDQREEFIDHLTREVNEDLQQFVKLERQTIAERVSLERVELLKAVDLTLLNFLAGVQVEREMILQGVQKTSQEIITESSNQAQRLVDRFLLFITLILLGFLAVGFMGGWFLIRFARQ
jgi:hypothetical protein